MTCVIGTGSSRTTVMKQHFAFENFCGTKKVLFHFIFADYSVTKSEI